MTLKNDRVKLRTFDFNSGARQYNESIKIQLGCQVVDRRTYIVGKYTKIFRQGSI